MIASGRGLDFGNRVFETIIPNLLAPEGGLETLRTRGGSPPATV
jgi:hypothetical protein